MILARRSFLAGLVSSLAAPAIVRIDNIMPVRAPRLLTRAEITREAIVIFKDCNKLLREIERYHYHDWPVGTQLHIRLPTDWSVQ